MIEILSALAFTALASLSFLLWRRRRDDPTRWLAVTLGILATVSAIGAVLPQSDDGVGNGPYLWFIKAVLILLLLYPYSLYRFMTTFGGSTRSLDTIALSLTAAVVVASAALPRLPAAADPRPEWLTAYILLIVSQWTLLSAITAQRLWRAGRGQPSVARRRMRMLAFGAGALAVAILPSIGPPASERSTWLQLISGVTPLVAALLFYLGFAPPGWLRVLWRRGEELQLRDVEAEMMAASTVHEVTDALLPQVARVCGSRGSLVLDSRGESVARYNVDAASAAALAATVLEHASPTRVVQVGDDLLAIPLRRGWLAVQLSPYTPLFGNEEIRLLEGLGVFIDLALERASSFERERAAREEIQGASAELETLVYGLSHDLKSPIITMLGYLEYLDRDFGDLLPDEGRHYLERMRVSGRYMQDLIHDLLELSRIGRVQTDAEDVDLPALVNSVIEQLRSNHAHIEVEVGPLPTVRMNPVRARQLFTNLLENAATHAGRDDLHIRVEAELKSDRAVDVTVCDDGKGIPPQHRERVFGIFERLEGQGDRSGTGMGLAICRKIVDQVGGEISIADADVGTRVCIHLPPTATVGGLRQLESHR